VRCTTPMPMDGVLVWFHVSGDLAARPSAVAEFPSLPSLDAFIDRTTNPSIECVQIPAFYPTGIDHCKVRLYSAKMTLATWPIGGLPPRNETGAKVDRLPTPPGSDPVW